MGTICEEGLNREQDLTKGEMDLLPPTSCACGLPSRPKKGLLVVPRKLKVPGREH